MSTTKMEQSDRSKLKIRVAAVKDAARLLEIYRPYVLKTAITFEYKVPSEEVFAERIRHTLDRYPYLVAEQDGEIVGYAYAGPFKERSAYDWAVETSIYVAQNKRRAGIGSALYERLEYYLGLQNIVNLNACIACPAEQDPYLGRDSIIFHEHLGYRMVGKFHQCGYKFGRWYHMVWMEKLIGAHHTEQPQVIAFPEILRELEKNK